MDRLTQIELFVQSVKLDSITRAAELLGMSTSAASRHLLALEQRVGVRLLERTTRRLWLTEAGRNYHQRCVAFLGALAEADAEASLLTGEPSGVLRVASSMSFAVMHIAPDLHSFYKRYPKLSIEIVAPDRYPNFVEAGIDVAIRTQEHEPGSGITVRRLADTPRALAASPRYLAKHGTPATPQELSGHRLLVDGLDKDPLTLHFRRGRKAFAIPITAALQANEGPVICAAGVTDAGILVQPLYFIHEHIVAGRLVPILAGWQLPKVPITIAYQSRKQQPAKISAFTQFLTDCFKQRQLEQKWMSALK